MENQETVPFRKALSTVLASLAVGIAVSLAIAVPTASHLPASETLRLWCDLVLGPIAPVAMAPWPPLSVPFRVGMAFVTLSGVGAHLYYRTGATRRYATVGIFLWFLTSAVTIFGAA